MILSGKMTLVVVAFLGVALAGCTGGSDADKLISTLHATYSDQPYKGGQQTPDHEWAYTDGTGAGGRIVFLHWMPKTYAGTETGGDPEKADHLFATGDGFKGRWCSGDDGVTPAEVSAGYVHFHKESSANWDAGHGGTSATQVGYWLRHVAAESGIEMMPGVVSKAGEIYPLMPSTSGLPDC